MDEREGGPPGHADSFDRIAADLQQLRLAASEVSYAEIVRRIGRHRESLGTDPAVARPARTTVYDAFRTDRSRINAQLVGEIVRALGAGEDEVTRWEQRCLRARREAQRTRTAEPGSEPTASVPRTSAPPSAPPPAAPPPAAPRPVPPPSSAPLSRGSRLASVLLLLVACLTLNYTGHAAVGWLALPLYLDMAGTALAAIVLGPWHGVAVALLTNILGMSVHGTAALPFGVVNVAGALVWGFGMRNARFSSSLPGYFSLNALTAVVCTVVAAPLLLILFHGGTGHAADSLTGTFTAMGEPLVLAVFQANLFTSVVDKLITGFVILAVLGPVGRWIRPPLLSAPLQNLRLHPAGNGGIAIPGGSHRPRSTPSCLPVSG